MLRIIAVLLLLLGGAPVIPAGEPWGGVLPSFGIDWEL